MKDDFDRMLEKCMDDSQFRAEYEALEPEFSFIQAVIDCKKDNSVVVPTCERNKQ